MALAFVYLVLAVARVGRGRTNHGLHCRRGKSQRLSLKHGSSAMLVESFSG